MDSKRLSGVETNYEIYEENGKERKSVIQTSKAEGSSCQEHSLIAPAGFQASMLHPVPAVALATGRESSLVMHVTMMYAVQRARALEAGTRSNACPMHKHAHVMLTSNTVLVTFVSQRSGREADHEMTSFSSSPGSLLVA